MKKNYSMFLKLNLKVLIIFFIFQNSLLFGFKKVVILAPSAGDIFKKLNLQNVVVGITKHMDGFPEARKVGSHLNPNIEIIKYLKPDLIIISSKKFFPEKIKKILNAEIYVYNPKTLSEILKCIKQIGKMFNKKDLSEKLILSLKNKLKKVKNLKRRPKVVYEIMENPYIVAGKKSIINDIIEKAGGINIIKENKKHVKFSEIKIRFLKPDIYIYQVGPMNKNPVNPLKRKVFKGCKFNVIKVDEKKFARPNTQSFDNVIYLNKLFLMYTK